MELWLGASLILGLSHELKQNEINVAMKILGVAMEPDGNMKQQCKYMNTHLKLWVKQMRADKLSKL